jgi:uncharacterized membrane protein
MSTTSSAARPSSAQDYHRQWAQQRGGLQQQDPHSARDWVNVGDTERLLSALAGTGLALFGLVRRSYGGLALAGLGASLIYRGATGHCPLYSTKV